ncbi:hypothetical protein TrST_g5450 [Triparma strigata]|nr:hypothetical protein TrST_g5450 [Triparma strigata]
MLRAVTPGRTLLINLPGGHRAAIISPVILKYLSLFERACREGRRDILYVNVPLQHEDIRFLTASGALVEPAERVAIVQAIQRQQQQQQSPPQTPVRETENRIAQARQHAALQNSMRESLNLPQLDPGAPIALSPLVPTPAPVEEPVSSGSVSSESLQNFVCSICLDYIQSPASATCKCTFCLECLNKWLETNTSCPTCRAPTSKSDVHSNPAIFDKGDPVVTCPHQGCEESLPLSQLKSHTKSCPFLPLKCKYAPFGCTHVCPSAQMAQHLATTCSFEKFKGLIGKHRLQETHIKKLSKNANLANNIIVQNSLHIQNVSERVNSLNSNLVNKLSDPFAYMRLYAISMSNPWAFNAKRQTWHDFLVHLEALSLYNAVICALPVLLLVFALQLKGFYKLIYINTCFWQDVHSVVNGLLPDDDAKAVFYEAMLENCREEKLEKITYIADSCCCLLGVIFIVLCVRPSTLATILKTIGLLSRRSFFEDPRVNLHSKWMDVTSRNYSWGPGLLFFANTSDRARSNEPKVSIFEVFVFVPAVSLFVVLFQRMGVESIYLGGVGGNRVGGRESEDYEATEVAIRLIYGASIYTLACFCLIAAPNISVGCINCNRIGDGNNDDGFTIKCKIRDSISLWLRIGVMVVVCRNLKDAFDTLAAIVALDKMANSLGKAGWDFFIIKEELGPLAILSDNFWMLYLAVRFGANFVRSGGGFEIRLLLFFITINSIYQNVSKTSLKIGKEMRKQILIANSPPQLNVFTAEQRMNAATLLHKLGGEAFGFFMAFTVVFAVALIKC